MTTVTCPEGGLVARRRPECTRGSPGGSRPGQLSSSLRACPVTWRPSTHLTGSDGWPATSHVPCGGGDTCRRRCEAPTQRSPTRRGGGRASPRRRRAASRASRLGRVQLRGSRPAQAAAWHHLPARPMGRHPCRPPTTAHPGQPARASAGRATTARRGPGVAPPFCTPSRRSPRSMARGAGWPDAWAPQGARGAPSPPPLSAVAACSRRVAAAPPRGMRASAGPRPAPDSARRVSGRPSARGTSPRRWCPAAAVGCVSGLRSQRPRGQAGPRPPGRVAGPQRPVAPGVDPGQGARWRWRVFGRLVGWETWCSPASRDHLEAGPARAIASAKSPVRARLSGHMGQRPDHTTRPMSVCQPLIVKNVHGVACGHPHPSSLTSRSGKVRYIRSFTHLLYALYAREKRLFALTRGIQLSGCSGGFCGLTGAFFMAFPEELHLQNISLAIAPVPHYTHATLEPI